MITRRDVQTSILPGPSKLQLFGPGPWVDEPDRVEWMAGQLACAARRGTFGAWNGYVGLPPGHPWETMERDAIDALVQVHGGVTFLDRAGGRTWIGFDCAHAFDLQPGLPMPILSTYRTVEYVMTEVDALAQQCKRAGCAIVR